MFKPSKLLSTLLAAGAFFSVAGAAVAGQVYEDRGNPHADEKGGSKHYISQTAGNTWEDWVWRGSKEGLTFKCPWNNGDPTCPITLEFSRSESHSRQVGFSFGTGKGNSSSTSWLNKALNTLSASFNYSMQTTWSNNFAFRPGGSIKRGQYAEPIYVQKRRWMRGYFHGGWVQTGYKAPGAFQPEAWIYSYNSSVDFGSWTSNQAEGASYSSFHIY